MPPFFGVYFTLEVFMVDKVPEMEFSVRTHILNCSFSYFRYPVAAHKSDAMYYIFTHIYNRYD